MVKGAWTQRDSNGVLPAGYDPAELPSSPRWCLRCEGAGALVSGCQRAAEAGGQQGSSGSRTSSRGRLLRICLCPRRGVTRAVARTRRLIA